CSGRALAPECRARERMLLVFRRFEAVREHTQRQALRTGGVVGEIQITAEAGSLKDQTRAGADEGGRWASELATDFDLNPSAHRQRADQQIRCPVAADCRTGRTAASPA